MVLSSFFSVSSYTGYYCLTDLSNGCRHKKLAKNTSWNKLRALAVFVQRANFFWFSTWMVHWSQTLFCEHFFLLFEHLKRLFAIELPLSLCWIFIMQGVHLNILFWGDWYYMIQLLLFFYFIVYNHLKAKQLWRYLVTSCTTFNKEFLVNRNPDKELVVLVTNCQHFKIEWLWV